MSRGHAGDQPDRVFVVDANPVSRTLALDFVATTTATALAGWRGGVFAALAAFIVVRIIAITWLHRRHRSPSITASEFDTLRRQADAAIAQFTAQHGAMPRVSWHRDANGLIHVRGGVAAPRRMPLATACYRCEGDLVHAEAPRVDATTTWIVSLERPSA